MKPIYKWCIFIILLVCSCSTEIPEDAFDNLKPPVIISCYQKTGDNEHIYVDFLGFNKEYYFDGYNIYVSQVHMIGAAIGGYKRVQIDEPGYASADPSYPLSPSAYNPSLVRTIKLNQYWCSDDTATACLFENNVRYYILFCSHHRFLGVKEDGVSNEATIDFVIVP